MAQNIPLGYQIWLQKGWAQLASLSADIGGQFQNKYRLATCITIELASFVRFAHSLSSLYKHILFHNPNKYKNVIHGKPHGYWCPTRTCVLVIDTKDPIVQRFSWTADSEIPPSKYISGTQGKD